MTSSMHRLQFIRDSLESRKKLGRFRELVSVQGTSESMIKVEGRSYLNLSSNDYLGLGGHPEVVNHVKYFTEKYGSGSGASRLITGSGEYHRQLETALADWLGTESALVFNSGYQLNSSILPTLADRSTVIYSDRFNHHSLIQGIVASRAKMRRYNHLDYTQLASLLHQDSALARKIIVTESLFSMDGDMADLDALSELADKYNAILVVDEAHAIGVVGPGGRGIGYTHERIDIRIGTFGKAFGSFGAYVAGSSELVSYLINQCGGFVYTTALPPSVVGATYAGLGLIKGMQTERDYLAELSNWFRGELNQKGFSTFGSTSHIVPVFIGNEFLALKLSETLKEQGYWVNAIRPPTVEVGTSRLRFSLNAQLSKAHLSESVEIMQKTVSSWT